MIPLLASILHALLRDEMAARRWLRGCFHGAALMGAQLLLAGEAAIRGWSLRDWAFHIAISGVATLGGLVSVGEKNKPPGQA